MTCSHCNGTGELRGMGYYDCTNCSAADERTALDAQLAALPPITRDDLNWAAYRAGADVAEARFALERAELVRQLRNMWGWAIELKHLPGYFDDESEEGLQSVEGWQATVEAARKLLQEYDRKDKPCKS